MLPGLNGLEVMRRVRDSEREPVAIILLTAKGDESDRVVGLRLGADDYMVKPFSPDELVARVDAVLRRFDTSPTVVPYSSSRVLPLTRPAGESSSKVRRSR